MNDVRTICFVALVASLVWSSRPATAEGPELKRLQGTWVGKEIGKEDEGNVTLTVNEDRIEFEGWSPREWYKGKIELDQVSKPKRLMGKIEECPVKEFIGKISHGIYELEKDSLSIAATAPGSGTEPQGFDDKGCRRFELKREP